MAMVNQSFLLDMRGICISSLYFRIGSTECDCGLSFRFGGAAFVDGSGSSYEDLLRPESHGQRRVTVCCLVVVYHVSSFSRTEIVTLCKIMLPSILTNQKMITDGSITRKTTCDEDD